MRLALRQDNNFNIHNCNAFISNHASRKGRWRTPWIAAWILRRPHHMKGLLLVSDNWVIFSIMWHDGKKANADDVVMHGLHCEETRGRYKCYLTHELTKYFTEWIIILSKANAYLFNFLLNIQHIYNHPLWHNSQNVTEFNAIKVYSTW